MQVDPHACYLSRETYMSSANHQRMTRESSPYTCSGAIQSVSVQPQQSQCAATALRSAVKLVSHAVLVFGDEGTVVAANRPASILFAYSAEELLGTSIEILLPELSEALHEAGSFSQGLQAADMCDRVVRGVQKNGASVVFDASLGVVTRLASRYLVVSVIAAGKDATSQTVLAHAPDEYLDVQRLVDDMAARLPGVASEGVDQAVNESLRDIAEALRLDGAVVWRRPRDQDIAIPTHGWMRQQMPGCPDNVSLASVPWIISRLRRGMAACFSTIEDLPHPLDRKVCQQSGSVSGAVFPLGLGSAARERPSAVAFSSLTQPREWFPPVVEGLRMATAVIGQAIARREVQVALDKALHEMGELKMNGTQENDRIVVESPKPAGSPSIVLESDAIKLAFTKVQQVAPLPATVLLLGETGSGKEVFAQAIHDLSPRHHRPMVTVNCAAIPPTLIESELFGRERGAYTGALSRQMGRFEAADKSTLFLDEIGELPIEIQVKLLRVLQERTFERLGSSRSIKVDVRIIAATNRNLEKAVENKTFREDLYYRLNVFPVVVPPLRERPEDIPSLIWTFIHELSTALGKPVQSISTESMQQLRNYLWPGNVRELRNVIERAIIACDSRHLTIPTSYFRQNVNLKAS